MRTRCNVTITFDREDRRYRGGETVSGTVQITPLEDIKSKAIILTHLWKTEGIGNSHSEKLQTIWLAEAQQLTAGQQLSFNFELKAPADPLPVRGKLISVTHVVSVKIEIPWAFNPAFEEDYLLEPGALPNFLPASRTSTAVHEAAVKKSGTSNDFVGYIILFLIIAAFLTPLGAAAVFFPRVTIPLLILAFAAIAWFFLRDRTLKELLGDVTLNVPHVLVAPGEPFLVELRLQPLQNLAINGISLKLTCEETAYSGSGTDKKRHNHTAFQQIVPLREACDLIAGEEVHERVLMKFPDISLWSFEADSNQIRWWLEARVDIPRFPDWTKSQSLQVMHPSFISHLPIEPELLPHWTNPAQSKPQSDTLPDSAPPGQSSAQSISAVIAEINALSVHSTARSSVIRKAAGQRFQVSVTIARSSSTLLPGDDDPLYTDGLTVDGTIDGTRQPIRVIALTAATPQITNLAEGDSWAAQVELIEWDSIYQRINARQVPQ